MEEAKGDGTRPVVRDRNNEPATLHPERIEPTLSQTATSAVFNSSGSNIFQGAEPDGSDAAEIEAMEFQTAEKSLSRCSVLDVGRCKRVYLETLSLPGYSGYNQTPCYVLVNNGNNIHYIFVKESSVTLERPISLRGRAKIRLLKSVCHSVVAEADFHTCRILPGSIVQMSAESGMIFEMGFKRDEHEQQPTVERSQSALSNMAQTPEVSNCGREVVPSGRHLPATPALCDSNSEVSNAEWPQPREPTETNTPRSPDTLVVAKRTITAHHAPNFSLLATEGYTLLYPDMLFEKPIRSIQRTVDRRTTIIGHNNGTIMWKEKGVKERITYYK